MATLTNPGHELFAQGLAKSLTQDEAYSAAGYTGDRKVASRLAKTPAIRARVAELLEKVAKRTEITVDGLTKRLMAIADLAESTGKSEDDEGTIKSSPKHLAVARQALMDVGKLNGLVIDKSAVAQTSLEEMLDTIASTGGAGAAQS